MNRQQIAELIPHKGPMCLLTQMIAWEADHIHCQSTTQRDANHPLAIDGRLPDVALVEYAAQAVALHGGLLARSRDHDTRAGASPGRLAALRKVRFHPHEHDLKTLARLDIHARRELDGASGLIYAFQVLCAEQPLAVGQLTVRLGSFGQKSAG